MYEKTIEFVFTSRGRELPKRLIVIESQAGSVESFIRKNGGEIVFKDDPGNKTPKRNSIVECEIPEDLDLTDRFDRARAAQIKKETARS